MVSQDWFDTLSVKAAMLMDAIEIYKTELNAAKNLHSNNTNISQLELQVTEVISKMIVSSQKNANSIPETFDMSQQDTANKGNKVVP